MKQKPYILFLWTGLVLIFISFFIFKENKSIDIHMHDTYLVIAHTHVLWLLAILVLFVWSLYLLTNRLLYSKSLTWAHVIITLLTILFFVIIVFLTGNFINQEPLQYYDFNSWNSFDSYNTFAKVIGISLFLLLFGQFVFVINLIAGVFSRLLTRRI